MAHRSEQCHLFHVSVQSAETKNLQTFAREEPAETTRQICNLHRPGTPYVIFKNDVRMVHAIVHGLYEQLWKRFTQHIKYTFQFVRGRSVAAIVVFRGPGDARVHERTGTMKF